MSYRFLKMHGCGNDFLILDDFGGHTTELTGEDAQFLCDRNLGFGADGVVMLRKGVEADAQWLFFNSDGSEAEMCGNAARCVVRYLHEQYFAHQEIVSLETKAGVIKGRKLEGDTVEVTLFSEPLAQVEMTEKILQIEGRAFQMLCVNTGVPHAVIEVKALEGYPVARIGAQILNHPAFAPAKTNVTFYQRVVGAKILATTFERGVEQETLACGTGAAAAAVVFVETYMESLPVEVNVPGGELVVDLSPATKLLLLRGPAKYVGEMILEALPSSYAPAKRYGGDGSLEGEQA